VPGELFGELFFQKNVDKNRKLHYIMFEKEIFGNVK